MAFTTPRTWVTSETVTATHMNTHVRDNLAAGFPTDAVFEAWSPTVANLTIGNGTLTTEYMQVGKLVFCKVQFVLGSTSAVGTAPQISLPVAAALATGEARTVGMGRIWSDSPSDPIYYTDVLVIEDSGTDYMELWALNAAGTYLTNTAITASVPVTWAEADTFEAFFAYEAA